MITNSELEKVLSKAEHDRNTHFRLKSFGKSEVNSNRRRFAKEFTNLLAKAGFNIDEANNMLATYRTEQKRIRENKSAHTRKIFAEAEKTFRHAIDARRITLKKFANVIQPSGPSYFFLDTPSLISASP